MSQPSTARPPTARLLLSAADFARASVGLLPVVLLLRAYERVLAGASHALPSASAAEWLRALLSDVSFTLCVAAVLALPVLALAFASPTVARIAHRAALVVVALVGAALAQYFAVTLVPLGADLFGYSWHDIRETVGASRGVSAISVLAFVLVGAAAWVLPRLALRLPWSRAAGIAFGVTTIGAICAPALLVPPASVFASDAAYFVAVNKTGWFVSRGIEHVALHRRTARVTAALSGYPLWHRATYDDVLGPQLTLGQQPPNIVMVIVEGLGRDFTGPHAAYGGFTPFLDSLADRSLSWDNFLSTSGRTFGILPSLLGSLPFGPTGFMELGPDMPRHVSLGTLLKPQGYVTSYFTGTNGQFDRIDSFMERQGVDRFVDASGFGAAYTRQPAETGGESWGYPDDALFRRSLQLIGTSSTAPRLDVYLTITTHEPFIPPNAAAYHARFEQRLAALPLTSARQQAYRDYSGVFETLLYLDDALRGFLDAYAKRDDYGRTIFIITGDHRLIPIPPTNRIARYHVPFVLFSPMLRAPHHIGAMSSHLDVTPSLLALLQHGYGMVPPDSASWLGAGLDTSTRFRHAGALALMRTKNELDEYLDGTHFLSGDQLFTVDSSFALTPDGDGAARAAAADKLDRFRAINAYVTTDDHVMPAGRVTPGGVVDRAAVAREDSVFRALGLERRTPVEAFDMARSLAAAGQYETARLVAQRLLRVSPSYHDARALLGRTYGWERRFDKARPILEDLVRRAPAYADGYAALVQLLVWQGDGATALASATRALNIFPGNPELLYGKARALELLGRKHEALAVLDDLRRVAPDYAESPALRRRLALP